MKDQQELIATHLMDVHNGNNWTDVNLSNTLKETSWQQAQQVTPISKNTIAAIVHHISFWNRAVAERASGKKPVIGDDNGFNVHAMQSEQDWENLKADNIRSAEELADAIRQMDTDKLYTAILPDHSTAYKNFQGQVEHVHYHLGQIVMLKKYLDTLPGE